MRTLVAASLVVFAIGCGSSQKSAQKSDPGFAQRATAFPQQPPGPKPVDVSRSTEPGPSGPAGVGR